VIISGHSAHLTLAHAALSQPIRGTQTEDRVELFPAVPNIAAIHSFSMTHSRPLAFTTSKEMVAASWRTRAPSGACGGAAAVASQGFKLAVKMTGLNEVYVMLRLQENIERSMQKEAVTDREGRVIRYRYAVNAANRAIELLGKELGMFTDHA
jgi:hypothetical protein